MKNIRLIIILFVCIACKNETKTISSDSNNSKIIKTDENDVLGISDGKYRIIFEGIFEEDDLLLVYYTTEFDEPLNSKKSLRKKIKGSFESQKVILVFQENERPYNLRIDFSDNKKQKAVKLNSIQFLDKFNKLTINMDNIEDFFTFNNRMSLNKVEKLLVGDVFQLNGKDAYNPYFIANKDFKNILKKFNDASLNQKKVALIDDKYNIDLKDGNLHLIIKGTFESEDLVIIFYTEDTLESFSNEKTIRKKVRGSLTEQELIFTFPNLLIPSKIKLDISDKKEQKSIDISSIEISTDKTKIAMDKTNFHLYFNPNNYIDYNKISGSFECRIIKENNIEKYNPYFLSSPRLVEELKYL